MAPDRLGSLNHALLTERVLRSHGVPLLGVVFSAPATPDDSTGTNADSLGRILPGLPVAALPRVAGVDEAADRLGTVAGWMVE